MLFRSPINPGSGDIDVVFVVDATGSMTDDIDAVRSNVSGILTKLASITDSYRVALVTYKDFSDSGGDPDDYPSQVNLDFTTDADALRSALGNLEVTGGGDWPETVYSGVTSALNLSWRSGVRKIAIVLGDAPAKEPEPHTGHDPSFGSCSRARSGSRRGLRHRHGLSHVPLQQRPGPC